MIEALRMAYRRRQVGLVVHWLSLAVICLLAGCGEESGGATVRGKVTFKGQPVTDGTITFVPQGMPSAWANLEPDGTFVLNNNKKSERIEPGTYTAFIVVRQRIVMPDEGAPTPPPPIPTAAMSQATSPLVYEIKLGSNEIDVNLDDLPRKK